MAGTRAGLFIGTSGWLYRHWRGDFYPPGLAQKDEFAFYCARFAAVELNSSFYRLPTAAAFAGWRKRSPPGFAFAVKASRYITHNKKLLDPVEPLALLLARARRLGPKLGPLLFQLPPRWAYNGERFAAFLERLPRRPACVFEFRHPSWFNEHAYGLMRDAGAGLCIYDLAGFASPRVVTSTTVYLRLHGPEGKYAGSYSTEALRGWARAIAGWRDQGREVHCYFDNDIGGHAPRNALALKALLGDGPEQGRPRAGRGR
jgi:uncharacterized protein YecE (DUF72 family)